MSKEGLNRVIGKMIADTGFRRAVFNDPARALPRTGFDLSKDEMKALRVLKPSDLKVLRKRVGRGPSAAVECTVSGIKSF